MSDRGARSTEALQKPGTQHQKAPVPPSLFSDLPKGVPSPKGTLRPHCRKTKAGSPGFPIGAVVSPAGYGGAPATVALTDSSGRPGAGSGPGRQSPHSPHSFAASSLAPLPCHSRHQQWPQPWWQWCLCPHQVRWNRWESFGGRGDLGVRLHAAQEATDGGGHRFKGSNAIP